MRSSESCRGTRLKGVRASGRWAFSHLSAEGRQAGGGGAMIDLSHLTEEEQEMIMMVLKRDEELKRAEEERIRKLEKGLHSGSQSDVKLKYLSGEWFYKAKSQRHSDKIHGSEIILASMKQGKVVSLDGSVRVERTKTHSAQSSDAAAPQKPARCFDLSQPPEMKYKIN